MTVDNIDMNNEIMQSESDSEVGRFNWGALALTPLWLFRNGFWLTTAIYMLFVYYYWPLNLALSVLFFIKGTEWSWGNGNRWKSREEFSESQYMWNSVGKLILAIEVVILLITGMVRLGIIPE